MSDEKPADGSPPVDASPDLAVVRRLEAVAFRGFPSASVYYDRTWALRLTAGHPAKRLNSVNPLDPLDGDDIERRLQMARYRFGAYGRELTIRQTPLAPQRLCEFLDNAGWRSVEQSLVMVAPLKSSSYGNAVDRVPLKDPGRWVDGYLSLSGEAASTKAGMVEILASIRPMTGLFMTELAGRETLSVIRCVCDGDLAGMFELGTHPDYRRAGHGRAIMASAMKWATSNGARSAWLQVVASNSAAISLYRALGFLPVYSYLYRIAPQ